MGHSRPLFHYFRLCNATVYTTQILGRHFTFFVDRKPEWKLDVQLHGVGDLAQIAVTFGHRHRVGTALAEVNLNSSNLWSIL